MLNQELNDLCASILDNIGIKISKERKSILEAIAAQIDRDIRNGYGVKFICARILRRSHFSQVWDVSLQYFLNEEIETIWRNRCHGMSSKYIKALRQLGFKITCADLEADNPHYKVYYSTDNFIDCYSKAYTDSVLPQKDFIAIMTCSDSDDNCPLVPGAKKRFSTTYDDPKEFDESVNPVEHYKERSLQIAHEALYTFQSLSNLSAKN